MGHKTRCFADVSDQPVLGSAVASLVVLMTSPEDVLASVYVPIPPTCSALVQEAFSSLTSKNR